MEQLVVRGNFMASTSGLSGRSSATGKARDLIGVFEQKAGQDAESGSRWALAPHEYVADAGDGRKLLERLSRSAYIEEITQKMGYPGSGLFNGRDLVVQAPHEGVDSSIESALKDYQAPHEGVDSSIESAIKDYIEKFGKDIYHACTPYVRGVLQIDSGSQCEVSTNVYLGNIYIIVIIGDVCSDIFFDSEFFSHVALHLQDGITLHLEKKVTFLSLKEYEKPWTVDTVGIYANARIIYDPFKEIAYVQAQGHAQARAKINGEWLAETLTSAEDAVSNIFNGGKDALGTLTRYVKCIGIVGQALLLDSREYPSSLNCLEVRLEEKCLTSVAQQKYAIDTFLKTITSNSCSFSYIRDVVPVLEKIITEIKQRVELNQAVETAQTVEESALEEHAAICYAVVLQNRMAWDIFHMYVASVNKRPITSMLYLGFVVGNLCTVAEILDSGAMKSTDTRGGSSVTQKMFLNTMKECIMCVLCEQEKCIENTAHKLCGIAAMLQLCCRANSPFYPEHSYLYSMDHMTAHGQRKPYAFSKCMLSVFERMCAKGKGFMFNAAELELIRVYVNENMISEWLKLHNSLLNGINISQEHLDVYKKFSNALDSIVSNHCDYNRLSMYNSIKDGIIVVDTTAIALIPAIQYISMHCFFGVFVFADYANDPLYEKGHQEMIKVTKTWAKVGAQLCKNIIIATSCHAASIKMAESHNESLHVTALNGLRELEKEVKFYASQNSHFVILGDEYVVKTRCYEDVLKYFGVPDANISSVVCNHLVDYFAKCDFALMDANARDNAIRDDLGDVTRLLFKGTVVLFSHSKFTFATSYFTKQGCIVLDPVYQGCARALSGTFGLGSVPKDKRKPKIYLFYSYGAEEKKKMIEQHVACCIASTGRDGKNVIKYGGATLWKVVKTFYQYNQQKKEDARRRQEQPPCTVAKEE